MMRFIFRRFLLELSTVHVYSYLLDEHGQWTRNKRKEVLGRAQLLFIRFVGVTKWQYNSSL
jgi:hypothetical protein